MHMLLRGLLAVDEFLVADDVMMPECNDAADWSSGSARGL